MLAVAEVAGRLGRNPETIVGEDASALTVTPDGQNAISWNPAQPILGIASDAFFAYRSSAVRAILTGRVSTRERGVGQQLFTRGALEVGAEEVAELVRADRHGAGAVGLSSGAGGTTLELRLERLAPRVWPPRERASK